jgi:hypothetical protein
MRESLRTEGHSPADEATRRVIVQEWAFHSWCYSATESRRMRRIPHLSKSFSAGIVFALLVASFAQSQSRDGVRVGFLQAVMLREIPSQVSVVVSDGDQYRAVLAPNGHLTFLNGPQSNYPNLFNDSPTIVPVSDLPPLVVFETWIEQPGNQYSESISGGFSSIERRTGSVIVHRYLKDELRRVYASYDLTIDSLADTTSYHVSLGRSSTEAPPPYSTDWKLISVTPLQPQLVKDHADFSISLNAPNSAGPKLVDYVHFGMLNQGLKLRSEVAHDFYAGDEKVQINAGQLSMNGVLQPFPAVTLSAPILWLYVPNVGRFILSVKPLPELGFNKAGEIRDNSLSFTFGGNIFRVDSADRMLEGSGTYNVYVHYEQNWRPPEAASRDHFLLGSAGDF